MSFMVPPVRQWVGVDGDDESNSRGTLVTSGAADTKGSWAEIVPATTITRPMSGFFLEISQLLSNAAYALDVGVGTNNDIIVADWFFLQNKGLLDTQGCYLPIRVAANARLAVRGMSTDAADKFYVLIHPVFGGGWWPESFQSGKMYQMHSDGTTKLQCKTTITVVNTKSAWVDIDASLDDDIKAWYYMRFLGDPAFGWTYTGLSDLGLGSTPDILLSDVIGSGESSNQFWPEVSGPYFFPIKSGTQVRARHQYSVFKSSAYDEQQHGIFGFR